MTSSIKRGRPKIRTNEETISIHRIGNKNYRVKHKLDWMKERNQLKHKYNDETLQYANNNRLPWESYELQYLRDNSKILTIRQIAFNLGRSYAGVLKKAHKEDITLMTYQKRMGLVKTEAK